MRQTVAGASKLGWMGEIEDQDKANAHAVGELGRLDPSYERAERVRVQARSVARGAEKMEAVFEKVRKSAAIRRPQHARRECASAMTALMCAFVRWCMDADVANVWEFGVCVSMSARACVVWCPHSAWQGCSRAARPPTATQRRRPTAEDRPISLACGRSRRRLPPPSLLPQLLLASRVSNPPRLLQTPLFLLLHLLLATAAAKCRWERPLASV